MNCETSSLLMNAALDGELSAADRAVMEQHVAACAECRDYWTELQSLDRELSQALSARAVETAVANVMRTIGAAGDAELQSQGNPQDPVIPDSAIPIAHRRSASPRGTVGIMMAVVCIVLIMAAVLTQWPVSSTAVAEIALTTGSVDVKQADSREWIAVQGATHVELTANARVRTQSKSLCEIHTKSAAIVRLNQETELVLHRSEKLELVAGELWCRAPESRELEICSSPAAPPSPGCQQFLCPSSTETQWRAMPNHALRCQDVSTQPVQVTIEQLTKCTLQPGECVTFQPGDPQPRMIQLNARSETNWQLPLMVLTNPDDLNLRQRLTDLLAQAGRAKAANLYEDQILQLGPVGALPLLAYVRSKESKDDPNVRFRAMRLAADMASQSAIQDLQALLQDEDPNIRQFAQQALKRLQPDRDFGE